MKIIPLHDQVVLLRQEGEQKTAGGIIIPDTAKEKPLEGKLVAVGPGRRDREGERIPIEAKEGDRVLFGRYAGTEIKIDGVEYLMMKADDILGILEP
jgi:chaperonin GroES